MPRGARWDFSVVGDGIGLQGVGVGVGTGVGCRRGGECRKCEMRADGRGAAG